MVNDPLKEKKAGSASSDIIINWKDFSIVVNDEQHIPFLAELMQKAGEGMLNRFTAD